MIAPKKVEWEYDMWTPACNMGARDTLEELNTRGKEGWQVFHIVHDLVQSRLIFWMKRAKVGENVL